MAYFSIGYFVPHQKRYNSEPFYFWYRNRCLFKRSTYSCPVIIPTVPIIIVSKLSLRTMLAKSNRQLALFETTRRLLAQIANEGLGTAMLEASATGSQYHMILRNPLLAGGKEKIICCIRDTAFFKTIDGRIVTVIRPGDLIPPVILQKENTECIEEWDPGNIFRFIRDWLPREITEHAREHLISELQNSAANQGKK